MGHQSTNCVTADPTICVTEHEPDQVDCTDDYLYEVTTGECVSPNVPPQPSTCVPPSLAPTKRPLSYRLRRSRSLIHAGEQYGDDLSQARGTMLATVHLVRTANP